MCATSRTSAPGCRVANAMLSASSTKSQRMWDAICQPTIILENTSIREREVHASLPGPQIGQIADPQSIGPVAVKSRLTRSGASGPWDGDRGARRLAAPLRAADACLTHQPSDVVAADLLALALQLMPHAGVPVASELSLCTVRIRNQALVLQ